MEGSKKIRIEFFYDCISPFSYFAFVTLMRYRDVWHNTEIVLRPFLLAVVMAKTGNLPPLARPWAGATAKEQAQHLQRSVAFFNVPGMLDAPTNFFGPDGPADPRGLARDFRYQRLLMAVSRRYPDSLEAVTGQMFHHIWANQLARDRNGAVIMKETTLIDICRKAGLSSQQAAECLDEAGKKENKAVLTATVEDAIYRGAYGSPTLMVRKAPGQSEMIFFGSDRFEQLAFATGLPWSGPDPARPASAKL